MKATTEKEMLEEVMKATGLPESQARIIVAIELGKSCGDVIVNGKTDGPIDTEMFSSL